MVCILCSISCKCTSPFLVNFPRRLKQRSSLCASLLQSLLLLLSLQNSKLLGCLKTCFRLFRNRNRNLNLNRNRNLQTEPSNRYFADSSQALGTASMAPDANFSIPQLRTLEIKLPHSATTTDSVSSVNVMVTLKKTVTSSSGFSLNFEFNRRQLWPRFLTLLLSL